MTAKESHDGDKTAKKNGGGGKKQFTLKEQVELLLCEGGGGHFIYCYYHYNIIIYETKRTHTHDVVMLGVEASSRSHGIVFQHHRPRAQGPKGI